MNCVRRTASQFAISQYPFPALCSQGKRAEALLSAFHPFSLEKCQRKGSKITRGKHVGWQSASQVPNNLFGKVSAHSLIGKSRTDTSVYEKIALQTEQTSRGILQFFS